MKGFSVNGRLLLHDGWHFVYLNEALSRRIRDAARGKSGNSPFVRVKATVGKTSWQTSLFRTAQGPYILPVKASVRHAEGIAPGDTVRVACVML